MRGRVARRHARAGVGWSLPARQQTGPRSVRAVPMGSRAARHGRHARRSDRFRHVALLGVTVAFLAMLLAMPIAKVGPVNAATGLSYATSVSANHRYLLDQNGKPFLVVGDSGWD